MLLAGNSPRVYGGPFAGMDYLRTARCSQILPKLIGSYEAPVHAWIREAVDHNYARILNVGCAEGYYAVGLARSCPQSDVIAFDTDRRARKLCGKLAAINGVDNLQLEALCDAAALERLAGPDTLVVMDVEGAERQLVDPETISSLCQADLIVELHDVFIPGTKEILSARLANSHDIEIVRDHDRNAEDYPALQRLPAELRAQAMDERRPQGMEWMRALARR